MLMEDLMSLYETKEGENERKIHAIFQHAVHGALNSTILSEAHGYSESHSPIHHFMYASPSFQNVARKPRGEWMSMTST